MLIMLLNELTANENIMLINRTEIIITVISGLGFVPSLGSCFAGLSGRQKIYTVLEEKHKKT